MENRRSARIPSDFWVTIEGVDDTPQLRTGNLGVTGVAFEVDRRVDEVGSVQWLHIASADHGQAVDVIARIIRVVVLDDQPGGLFRAAVAFEFMPERCEICQAIERLVRKVVSQGQHGVEINVDHRFEAKLSREAEERDGAVVRRLSVRRLVLQTNWPLTVGESVRVEIPLPAGAGSIRFEGAAGRVTPGERAGGEQSFVVEVEIRGGERHGPSSGPSEPADLVTELLVPSYDQTIVSRKEHLTGQLSRIRVPSLLSLFEMERMSGVLRLSRGDQDALIHVLAGRLIDVEAGGRPPKEVLARLIQWDEGVFEFTLGAVERPDRIGMSTTALLIDLARAADEASR
ncbi:MAG: DUF4388 domain-containing protein [Myxococcales bacterium]|nr:DUF4388 domain-containing protein [Myxococcales bacterium]